VGEGLPKIPHHSEGQGLPLDEAVALVERVRVSAERHAVLALDDVAMAVPRGRVGHRRAEQFSLSPEEISAYNLRCCAEARR
jgi:hypothetical protein